tara:strand:+ start:4588 stop:8157 length:3570 start_codon:yes stop_codon:yes gene_type:complete
MTGLSGIEDSTANNLNYLFLTKTTPVNNILKVNKSIIKYPYYRTTWLKAPTGDSFLEVNTDTGTTILSGLSANISTKNIFELEFIDSLHVAIKHYDNQAVKFLTLNQTNSSQLSFSARQLPLAGAQDTQIFTYILENDTISFIQSLSTIPTEGELSKRYPFIISGMTSISGDLSASELGTRTSPFSSIDYGQGVTVFKIRPDIKPSTTYDLNDSYVGYLSGIDHNSLNVDERKTISNLQNNFLLYTATDDLNLSSKSMDLNVIPLKNQVTIEGNVSKGNPYQNEETEATHREYHKLHTGTHQKYGNDNIHATFTAGINQLHFPSDKLTYFHMPQTIAPYTQLNVNDSTLVKLGAVPGDTPGVSDKVFKQRRTVYNFNNPIDELNGTFLCSWLSGNDNSNMTPVWVDRYFNSSYLTKHVALTAGVLEPVPYIDSFTALTKHVGASAGRVSVFDKFSDLVFEPGGLYAYHHVGRGNAQKLIYSLEQRILFKDLKQYTTFNGINELPIFDTQEDVHVDANGNVATGTSSKPNSIEVPLLYEFDRNRYAITDIIKHTGSFTLNFWLWCKDWTKPFTYQVLGNWITKGFGIFNEQFVTPFIAIPDENKVHIYNTDFTYLATHKLGRNIVLFNKKGTSENFWIVDDNNDIYEYDINGVIQDKIVSTRLTGREPVDLELSQNTLYVLFRPNSGENADYFKYDYTRVNEQSYNGYVSSGSIWNFRQGVNATSTNNLSTCKLHVVKIGLSGGEGVLITQQDVLSSNTTNYNTLTSAYVFANGSTVDNNGVPWTLQNGVIYTYSPLTSTNIAAMSASKIIEGVNVDKNNHVWVLHDYDRISKLDSNRNLLFTSSLSSLLPLSATRHNRSIDYVAEFGNNGYEQYPFVITQSVSGTNAYKLNPDNGHVVTEVVMLTGDTPVVTYLTSPSSHKTYTGHDYLRKNERLTGSRLDAKLTVTSVYNTSTTTQTYSTYTLSYDLSGLSRGWHNFNITVDTEQGFFDMHIDAVRVNTIPLSAGKFTYSDIFDSPLIVGAAPFYTKLLLQEHLQQPRYYLANNIKMKNIKLYDKPLGYYDIKNHYQVLQDVTDIRWDTPVGQRNYIDTVERIFKHSLPGRKSELINVNIKNSNITDVQIINDITDKVKQKLQEELPIYNEINELTWSSRFQTVSAMTIKPKIMVWKPDNDSTSTTSKLTGDTITYEH